MRETRLGNKTGNKAGDDAGDETRETGDDSGDGGRAGELLTTTWGEVRAGALPSLGYWQIQRLAALRGAAEPKTGQDTALEALWSQGRAMTQRCACC